MFLFVCMYVEWYVCVSEGVSVNNMEFLRQRWKWGRKEKKRRDRQYIISPDDKAYDDLEISLNVEFDCSSSNAIILDIPFAFP